MEIRILLRVEAPMNALERRKTSKHSLAKEEATSFTFQSEMKKNELPTGILNLFLLRVASIIYSCKPEKDNFLGKHRACLLGLCKKGFFGNNLNRFLGCSGYRRHR